MGVPTFYRWLAARYPKIVKDCVEEDEILVNGTFVPSDLVTPNPNGVEFDCLYLDMNGIIHPCTHPEEEMELANEDDMFKNIFQYIDRVFNIVRPRKLIYLAIDGVAPRAKMNQQRSRRFKAAKELENEKGVFRSLCHMFSTEGRSVPKEKIYWDSNVITPGTTFMSNLAEALRVFIMDKLKTVQAWKNIVVILSDSNSPGEGEHKIVQFIRTQRLSKTYNSNCSHVLYGMDADLIMLGLATHEPNFFILRESVTFDPKEENSKNNLHPKVSTSEEQTYFSQRSCTEMHRRTWKPLQFVDLGILREYLFAEFSFNAETESPGICMFNTPESVAKIPSPVYQKQKSTDRPCQNVYDKILNNVSFLPFPYDFERCVDDFVFMCFFCGNDFLPNLPSVSIMNGSIDMMILLYQKVLHKLGGYLTSEGTINFLQVSQFISYIGDVERDVFLQQRSRQKYFHDRQKEVDDQSTELKPSFEKFLATLNQSSNVPQSGLGEETMEDMKVTCKTIKRKVPVEWCNDTYKTKNIMSIIKAFKNKDGAFFSCHTRSPESAISSEEARNELFNQFELHDTSGHMTDINNFKKINSQIMKSLNESTIIENQLHLGVGNKSIWRSAYYRKKFHLEHNDDVDQFSREVKVKYCEGLSWVLAYYYQGCASWSWFYPYHFAPLASDICGIESFQPKFIDSGPLKPFEQLMAVLPVSSSHCLPDCYANLMKSPFSPIIDFYPIKFMEDKDNKKYSYQWKILLPFISEHRLKNALKGLDFHLTDEELKRNSISRDQIFAVPPHTMASQISMHHNRNNNLMVFCLGTDNFCVSVQLCQKTIGPHFCINLPSPADSPVVSEFSNNPKEHHSSRLLEGVAAKRPVLTKEDLLVDSGKNRFNCVAAKRIIMNSISGVHKRPEQRLEFEPMLQYDAHMNSPACGPNIFQRSNHIRFSDPPPAPPLGSILGQVPHIPLYSYNHKDAKCMWYGSFTSHKGVQYAVPPVSSFPPSPMLPPFTGFPPSPMLPPVTGFPQSYLFPEHPRPPFHKRGRSNYYYR